MNYQDPKVYPKDTYKARYVALRAGKPIHAVEEEQAWRCMHPTSLKALRGEVTVEDLNLEIPASLAPSGTASARPRHKCRRTKQFGHVSYDSEGTIRVASTTSYEMILTPCPYGDITDVPLSEVSSSTDICSSSTMEQDLTAPTAPVENMAMEEEVPVDIQMVDDTTKDNQPMDEVMDVVV